MLQAEGAVSIYAVSGMGGLGKTELALQYAKEHLELQSYPGGVCWIRARQEIAPQITAFVRSSLNREVPLDREIQEQVKWCWQHWDEGDVLIVLDDVQDYRDVEPWLRHHESRFKVLLTTRSRLGWGKREIELQVLSEAKALELLGEIVTDGRIEEQIEDAKALCQWLGYLPLGLELAARYLVRKQDISLATLRQRLEDQTLNAKALVQPEDQMTAKLGVAAAFELSWELLDEQAKQLAGLLSVFAAAPMRWEWVQACLPEWDEETLEDVRDYQLLGLNLVERMEASVYQLHPLIREFFGMKREQMANADEMKRSFCQMIVEIAKQIPHPVTVTVIERVKPAIPHLKEAATTLNSWLANEDLITPSNRIAGFYTGQSAFGEAEEWYLHGRAIAMQWFGHHHLCVAQSLNNLAELYRLQGRYGEAEPLHLQALEIYQRQQKQDHPNVAISLNNLGALYELQGRYEEAEPLHLQALETSQQQLGQDHPEVAASLNNLAVLYDSQGRYAEAEPLYWQALQICQRQLGQDHPHVASSLNNLAGLYDLQGRYAEAEAMYLQALEIYQWQLGQDHPNVAQSLNNLAELYRSQERYMEAEPLYLQALEVWQRQLGQAYPDVARSLNNLAELYRSQERYMEAEPLYLQALQIGGRTLRADHQDVAIWSNNLAGLYVTLGRYAEAEPLYLYAIGVFYQRLGETHPNTQTALQSFISLVQQVVQENRTDELSDRPMTRSLLQQLQPKKSKKQARGFGKRSQRNP